MTLETPVKEILAEIRFNDIGLIPAIAQQYSTNQVLMLAWMNSEAVAETLQTQSVCYWSRSRNSLWRKGETSGMRQKLIEFRWDCDADTVLLLVDQTGVACHTGRGNCFFRAFRDNAIQTISSPRIDPVKLYDK